MKNKGRTLRLVGLGLFFLAFGLIKLTASDFWVGGPYKMFYKIGFPTFLVVLIGIVQIFMAISFFSKKYVNISAWLAVVMLGATLIATLPKLLTLFQLPPETAPPGFLFVAAIPVFFMALAEALRSPPKE